LPDDFGNRRSANVMMNLKGKAALVTGASRGVGAATARLLAAEGCDVAINHRASADEAGRVAGELTARGVKVITLRGDVASDADCRRLVADSVAAFGRLDILVNSAGTTRFIDFPRLDDVTDEVWDAILGTNVKGVFQCARAAAPHLKATGDGVIINVASIAAFIGAGSSIPYCASKAAVVNLTVSLARTLCPEIRVNGVAPGVIDGEWLRRGLGESFEDVLAAKAAEAPLKKVSRPEDIADVILSLIRADLITGQTLTVDAGASLGPPIQRGIR
jgi:3-oxoacyl-[acyl-carrier protein] reductase